VAKESRSCEVYQSSKLEGDFIAESVLYTTKHSRGKTFVVFTIMQPTMEVFFSHKFFAYRNIFLRGHPHVAIFICTHRSFVYIVWYCEMIKLSTVLHSYHNVLTVAVTTSKSKPNNNITIILIFSPKIIDLALVSSYSLIFVCSYSIFDFFIIICGTICTYNQNYMPNALIYVSVPFTKPASQLYGILSTHTIGYDRLFTSIMTVCKTFHDR